MLGSGAFGVLLYFTLTHTIPRLGVGAAVTLILVGELLTGLLIDQFGWFGVPVRQVDFTRVIAATLLLVSGYLLVR
jgi:transporter family-2 protein